MIRSLFTFITIVVISLISLVSEAKEKVTFYTEAYSPFQSQNQQGQLVGFSIDILHATQQYVNFDIDIQMMPWSRAYRNAQKHPNTFIFSIGKTDKRLTSFKWVSDFYTVQDAIYKQTARTDIDISNPDDIDRYNIALSRNDVSLERLNIEHDYANVYLVTNQTTAVKMLQFGRVDLNYNNQIGFNEAVKNLGFNHADFTPAFIVSKISLGLATHKDTRIELFNQMQQAFDTIKENGEFNHVVAKWFPGSDTKKVNSSATASMGIPPNLN
jgi:polar amino acid transport system substrate-binding protein